MRATYDSDVILQQDTISNCNKSITATLISLIGVTDLSDTTMIWYQQWEKITIIKELYFYNDVKMKRRYLILLTNIRTDLSSVGISSLLPATEMVWF